MPKFAANVTTLFQNLPLEARLEKAAALGFQGVEILFPYEHDKTELLTALNNAGLSLALINTPVPDWGDGGRGIAAIPDEQIRFQREFEQALEYAEELGADYIHIMSGITTGDGAFDQFCENIDWAAAQAPRKTICLEPLNRRDVPNYFLGTYDLAVDAIETIARRNVKLQYDLYHATLIQDDPFQNWENIRRHIAHVQISTPPNRTAPDVRSPAMQTLISWLMNESYEGWISAEYPSHSDDDYGWVAPFLTVLR